MENKIKRWLDCSDSETAKELKGLNSDELYDRFYKEVEFGTGGMRGIIGTGTNRINRYTVAKTTLGYARFIKSKNGEERGIVIAYDNRRCSRYFAEVTAGVLASEGIKSYLFEDIRTTPELSFSVRELNAFGGIVITASHNPPEYNGYKIYNESGGQLVPSEIKPILEEMSKIEDELSIPIMAISEAGELVTIIGKEIDEKYYENVLSLQFDKCKKKDVKIVYSPEHGTGNIPVHHILGVAGLDVISVESQCPPDPNFSCTKNPNPEMAEAYEEAIKLMKSENADLAIATDPDCDRLGVVVNNSGTPILLTGNQSGAILLYYILSRHKEQGTLPDNAVIFSTVVTSVLGDKIAEDFGVDVEKTLTGFKFIGEKIRVHEEANDKSFIFGYEESNGCLIGDFVRDKDGVQASLMMCEAANYYKKQGKTLIQVLDEIYEKYGRYNDLLHSITLKGEDGNRKIIEIMTRLREHAVNEIAGLQVSEILDFKKPQIGFPLTDLIIYRFENGSFVAIRPSGTEPKCKFYYCILDADITEIIKYFEGENR
ncbi:MAG: phospho-sugar mutase [Clostridia bacterium]|nr:phospho-sugar mutase [Clostridia bacterium]